MYCKKIAVKVQHWDGSRQKKSSFFVVEVDRDEDDDVFELIGIAKVDAHSMRRLRDWQRGEFKELTLLVSIDLKYVIVANRDELHHIYDEKQHLEIDLNGDAGVYGNPQHKFVHVIERDMNADPELAAMLGVRPRPAAMPARMRLGWVHGSLESMEMPIQDAYTQPEEANADALIFAFLAKENWHFRPEDMQHRHVELVVWSRCQSGHWRVGGPLSLYDPKGLTLDELVQRRKRAIRNRNAYWRKFPNPWEIEGFGGSRAIVNYLNRLSDDELVEMAVVAWYSSTQLGAREKSVVIATTERFGARNDFA
jgi:hypothetical protein